MPTQNYQLARPCSFCGKCAAVKRHPNPLFQGWCWGCTQRLYSLVKKVTGIVYQHVRGDTGADDTIKEYVVEQISEAIELARIHSGKVEAEVDDTVDDTVYDVEDTLEPGCEKFYDAMAKGMAKVSEDGERNHTHKRKTK